MSAPAAGKDVGRRTRVIAAAVMLPVAVLAVLFLPSAILAAAIGLLMMVGLWEWSVLAGLSGLVARAAYLVVNAIALAGLAWAAGPELAPIKLATLAGVAWWLLVPIWLLHFDFARQDTAWSRALKLFAGSAGVIPAWSALFWLHHGAAGLGHAPSQGPVWTLFVLLVVWAADTGAYFAGSRWGRRKLAPRISPGKSWEGLFGGLFLAMLVSAAAVPVLRLGWGQLPQLLMLVMLTVLVSIAGDLFESLVKRHAGAKDSSHLIPGHGGVLDRIDSLLAALPVFVLGKIWLEL